MPRIIVARAVANSWKLSMPSSFESNLGLGALCARPMRSTLRALVTQVNARETYVLEGTRHLRASSQHRNASALCPIYPPRAVLSISRRPQNTWANLHNLSSAFPGKTSQGETARKSGWTRYKFTARFAEGRHAVQRKHSKVPMVRWNC